MRRLLFVVSMAWGLVGCGPEEPPDTPDTRVRWSAAQTVGPAFRVAPTYVTIHSPGQQAFVAPRVTWTDGAAVAVWSDLWSGIWASWLPVSGTWTSPVPVASPDRVLVPRDCSPFPCTGRPLLGEAVDVAGGPDGALTLWHQTEHTGVPGIWTADFAPPTTWSRPLGAQALPPGWFTGPVARSAGSLAVAAWVLDTDDDSTVWAQRFAAGAPLDPAARMGSAPRFSQGLPAVDVDAAGAAVVVWTGLDGVHARWYETSGGWGTDRLLPGANAACAVVAQDGAGGAIAAWLEGPNQSTTEGTLNVARLGPGGWQAREPATSASSPSHCPRLAAASSGEAVLVWPSLGPDRGLWARPLRRSAASPRRIDTIDAAHEIRSLRVAMNGRGNGYAAWVRARSDTALGGYPVVTPPTGTVWASRFTDGGADWEAASLLQGLASTPADVGAAVDVAVDADDEAVAFWFEFADGQFTPRAARTVRP